MGLQIVRSEDPSQASGLVADRRLYLDAARSHLVEENDPAAAYLLAAPGQSIRMGDVARLGLALMDGKVQQAPLGAGPPEKVEVAPSEAPAAAPATRPRRSRGAKAPDSD